MSVKNLLLFIILSFAPIYTYAQLTPVSYSIKGTLIDSTSKEAISFATISLKNSSSVVIKSIATKEAGTFLLEKINAGKYVITIIHAGYITKTIAVNLSETSQVDLGNVLLIARVNQLKEIVISADKPLVKQEIDKLTYNIQADPDSKSNNMLEMMRKVPLISMDGDDNLMLKGSTSFKVLINGKSSGIMAQSPRDALQSIPASSILRVEVITTPSAKYDSEGLTGIINIITNRKVDQGYNGSIQSYWNTRLGKGFSGFLTVKMGKFGVTGNFANQYYHFLGTGINNERIVFKPDPFRVEQTGTNNKNRNSGNYGYRNIDLSYDIDSLNLLTASVAFDFTNRNQNGNQLFRIFDQFQNLSRSYLLNNNDFSKNSSKDIGVNYQRGFKNNKERLLTLSYTYSSFDNNQNNNNIAVNRFNYSNDDLQQQNKAGSKEQTVQVDYVQPVGKLNAEGGVKFIGRDYYSDFESKNIDAVTAQVNSTLANQYDYTQSIYGFYNSYQYKLKSWGVKAGLRLERTVNNADFITQSSDLHQAYNNFVPTVVVQHSFSKTSNISVGYTQRIQRPGIGQLNPFINKSNPLFYTSGNPDLLPVLNHNFEITYSNFKKGSVYASLNYSFANNTIQNVVVQGADLINRSTFENIGKNDILGFDLSVNYPITRKLSTNFNGRLSYLWTSGLVNGTLYKNDGAQANISNLWTYTITGGWRVSYNINANTTMVTLQGRSQDYMFTTFRVYKDFFNKKLTAQVAVYNPFQASRHLINRVNSADFMQTSDTRVFNRGFFATFTYRFGKLKESIKKNKRGVTNDDVKNPTSGND